MITIIDTLIHARWIIPIEPYNSYLENHALAIDKGRIVAILPSEIATANYQANSTLHLHEHVLLPGLVNAHTHSPMSLLRGLADDVKLMDWLKNYIWPVEKACLHEEFVTVGTELALLEMMKTGTTCCNEHYLFPATIAKVVDDAGFRACIGQFLIDFPTAWSKDAKDCLTKGESFYQQYKDHELISISLAPHAPYSVADAELLKIKELSARHDLPIHMHIHETKDEVEQELAKHNVRPLARLHSLGLLTAKLQGVHLTQLTPQELDLIKNTGMQVIHCPRSNLKLASGFCPTNALLEAGVNVALGTDSAASNNKLDMFSEMQIAALIAKATCQDATVLPAAKVLQMATLNGARALGLEHKIGSLVPGKDADLIAVNLATAGSQPVYNPISQLVYAAYGNQVSDVWVAGRQLVSNGKCLTLDENTILTKVKKYQAQVIKSLA